MRIAQIAPLHEAVPPKLYGGTERVVSFLTEELVAMGHDVTLFASGDSVTSAKLNAVWPRALRLDPAIRDPIAPHMLLMETVRQVAHEFDVLHFHMDYWSFSLFSRQDTPFVTTMHGRLDLTELQPEPFCEVSRRLAEERGLTHGDWVTIVTARTAIEARVLVTDRMRSLRLGDRFVEHVGLPRRFRRDAAIAGAEFAMALDRVWEGHEARGVPMAATLGRFDTDAALHGMTFVPGLFHFSLDVRAYDEAVLAGLDRRVDEIVAEV